MKCRDCEKMIYGYRELSDAEKQNTLSHIETCAACKKLFGEMQHVHHILQKSEARHSNPQRLTSRVMGSIPTSNNSWGPVTSLLAWLDTSVIRYSMVGTSLCLLILFFAEVSNSPDSSRKVRGPVANLQGVFINSQELRKDFTARREKKRAVLSDCARPFTQEIDLACLKGKIKKLNF
jgi:hypothetical protein